jgi:uncharacterized PurR-regulated membrane protein YhhQ (DUF165 family)
MNKVGYTWMVVYIVAVMAANYTATWFIPLPVFGLLSVGTLIFGITFTARDFVHKMGRPYVYGMIGAAAILTSIMALFTDTPYRIILASFVTILIAETADTEVYQRFIQQPWLVRVSASNAVSVPLDSILFSMLAFFGVMPTIDIVAIIWADIIWKWATGLAFALLHYVGFKEAVPVADSLETI